MSRRLMNELERCEYAIPLKQFHRDAMLDLILAWGSLDGALTMLVAAFTGEPLYDAAERIGKDRGSSKLLEIARILDGYEDGAEFAKNFKKLKKQYEKFSKVRNCIAHGHCPGYLLSDDQYIVFAIAKRVGDVNLAVEAIPIDEMKKATKYGEQLAGFSVDTAKKMEAANSR